MSIINSIASASISLKSTEIMTNMNLAMMGKTMDIAEEQGQALQEMLEAADPGISSSQLLDVYA